MWVLDGGGRVYAYDVATKARKPTAEFAAEFAGLPLLPGLWSDGSTMWVMGCVVGEDDYCDLKLQAYDMATKARRPDKDAVIPAATGNRESSGIWSDGRTMWIADQEDHRIYAYDLATWARAPDRDFDVPQLQWNFNQRWGSRTADETRIRAYRSSDTVISRSDAEVGFNRVAGLAPDGAGIRAFVVSAPSIPGTYYYGACVDSVSGERNMTNNCSAGVAVTVGTSFTDDPVEAGVTAIKAVHFTELREHINALRASHGLFPFPWTDATLRAGTTRVAAVHVSELREALRQAYDAAGQSVGFSTAPAQAGGLIRAAHVNELRRAVEVLERRP